VAIASMMGLALGVDYALLMVSRFRQEREGGSSDVRAMETARRAAGQTIVFAGGTLAFVMLAAAFVAPGDLLLSVAAGVVVSTLLSVVLAVSLMPALLQIMMPHLDRLRLPRLGRGNGLVGVAERAIARPWLAIPLVLIPVLAIGTPAAALSMGPPDPRQLPTSDPTRQGFEALRKAIGPGWVAPFVVVATAEEGPLTRRGRLAAVSRWQDRIAADPGVEAVIGPAALAEAERPLGRLRRAYREAPARLARAQHGITALRRGLHAAADGVAELRSGLGAAAGGSALVAARIGDARAGAARLRRGLGRAASGSRALTEGIARAERGSGRLVRGERRLRRGVARLTRGLRRLETAIGGAMGRLRGVSAQLRAWSAWLRSLRVPTVLAAERLDLALRELSQMTVGKGDPAYGPLQDAVREAAALVGDPTSRAQGAAQPGGTAISLTGALVEIEEEVARSLDSLAALPDRVERVAGAVGRLRRGGERLTAGARKAERGSRALRAGLRRLRRGGHRLGNALARAGEGSDHLVNGLSMIAGGAERLSTGLSEGRDGTASLAEGLARPQRPLRGYSIALRGYERDYHTLRTRSPGAIDSGFLMLAGLDGAVPAMRAQIAQVANLDRGAQAVRILVVPRSGPSAPETVRLSDRLQRRLPALARAGDARVEIGEGAQALADYSQATVARVPWLVFALCFVSTVMLIAVLRSLLLPLVAVALNLLTVTAAFGTLQVFFQLDLLVGPSYIDAISAAGVLTIMFVLSIDYEVFLLSRMREVWLQTGDHEHAIAHGLRHTAGVITGAAVIMSSVFLVFATTDIASLQQFGAGLTFAVVLDATVVRLVLLPAVMRALGPRTWWLPAWLDRRLPQIEHGTGAVPDDPPEPQPAPESPVDRLHDVAEGEHRRLLDLLAEIELASELREGERVRGLAREMRALAEPHFRYEQRALLPQLVDTLGAEHVEGIYAAQESVVEALARIEELSDSIRVYEPAVAETRRLLSSARSSVIACDALSSVVDHQPPEVAERVLAARERVLAGAP
jgi:RND superfamily putative drug exporter